MGGEQFLEMGGGEQFLGRFLSMGGEQFLEMGGGEQFLGRICSMGGEHFQEVLSTPLSCGWLFMSL